MINVLVGFICGWIWGRYLIPKKKELSSKQEGKE
jgi:hypothetical protein